MNEWWITNISNKNVTLADLALIVKAGCSLNLLDKKHFSYDIDVLEKSRSQGSIFKKRDKIKVGITHQQIHKDIKYELSNQKIQTKLRSVVKIDEFEYDNEWTYSDEAYAEEMTRELDE